MKKMVRCKICGVLFETTSGTRKYCSPVCLDIGRTINSRSLAKRNADHKREYMREYMRSRRKKQEEKELNNSKWVPVTDKGAENGSIVCDTLGNVFIADKVVVVGTGKGTFHYYDGKDYHGDLETFLKGEKITTSMGSEYYIRPAEIIAWMPIPEPYRP